MFDRDSKTEKPTPRRRQQAREKGSVARSQDLNSAVLLLGAAISLSVLGSGIINGLGEMLKDMIRRSGSLRFENGQGISIFQQEITVVGKVIFPFLLSILVIGLVVNISQVGFKVSWKAAAPQWNRLNPLSGFKRFFSVRALVELGKSLLKLTFVGLALYFAIKASALQAPWLFYMPTDQVIGEIGI